MSMLKIIVPTCLAFGTSTVVISKLLFSLPGKTYDGVRTFNKPWFQTDSMFVGMMICLLVYVLKRKFWENPASSSELQPLNTKKNDDLEANTSGSNHSNGSIFRLWLLTAIPACCDMSATVIMNIGLQWIPGSVWQMLRGSMVIFSAIISILFLGRRLVGYHWAGIGIVTCALCMVGVACIEGPSAAGQPTSDSTHEAYGIILVLVAQVIQASQVVVEEFLMKNAVDEPLLIVGFEGFWGFSICSFIMLPIFQYVDAPGFSEDTAESLYMVAHNPSILFTSILYAFCILGYNATGMMVTSNTSAIHRTLLEGARTMCIWVANLFIHYAISSNFGELWSTWSFLQLAGFVTLFFGFFVYERFYTFDCLPAMEEEDSKGGLNSNVGTPLSSTSPAPGSSTPPPTRRK